MRPATKRAKSILFSRAVVMALMLLVQILVLLLFIARLSRYFAVLYGGFVLLSVVVAVSLVNARGNPSYKMAWLIPILLLPLFGGVLYLLFGRPRMRYGLAGYLSRRLAADSGSLAQDPSVQERLRETDRDLAAEARVVAAQGWPVWEGTQTRYFPSGEAAFAAMKEALRAAKRSIYLEYYLIGEGKMWGEILGILTEKAAAGVDVRVLYDGFGCILTLPSLYDRALSKRGIRSHRFLRVLPILSGLHNNRDHRKLTVIDGEIAFVGGYNLADEYINAVERFGHWKDAGLEVRGAAVRSFSHMFLSLWGAATEESYRFEGGMPPSEMPGEGFVQPYGSDPFADTSVAASVYLDLIRHAHDYLYISTPYLVIDHTFETALILAAKSGTDVRIFTPHVPDKWYVHSTTRAHYPRLLEAGVRIFEYTPGFLHAKLMVSDDRVAVVGSVNLDYRSLCLLFECGVWVAHSDTVLAVRDDLLRTMEVCEEITPESGILRTGVLARLTRTVLRLFAPLM